MQIKLSEQILKMENRLEQLEQIENKLLPNLKDNKLQLYRIEMHDCELSEISYVLGYNEDDAHSKCLWKRGESGVITAHVMSMEQLLKVLCGERVVTFYDDMD